MTKFISFVLIASFAVSCVYGFGPKLLYSLSFDRDIASVKVINRQLIIMAPYQIMVIDNIQWKFRQKNRMKTRILNKDIADPRMIGKIPARTFKGDRGQSYWVSSRGNNETNGALYVMKQTATYSDVADITVDSGWNYEKAQWVDMNRDGRRDCLTARYRGGVGQMLWFEQPIGQSIWGQRIIHEGLADGNFIGFLYDKKSYIVVAGNQFNSLGLYWTMNPKNNWKYSRQVRHRVIDNYGKYFDVEYVDLNKDNRADILTTTIQISSSRGQVLAYEIPYDIQNADWKRHVLAAGFFGDYSPGKATAFWPNKWKRKSDRPSIFLTGGSEATLYILSPTPKNKGFGYYTSELSAGTGIPGLPYIVDLNGDSFPELFVPQGSQLHVFSYDYSASAANPPKRKPSNGAGKVKITKKPVVYRPPFFRPPPTTLPPAIPADASPVALAPQPNPGFTPLGNTGSGQIAARPAPLPAPSRPETPLLPLPAPNPVPIQPQTPLLVNNGQLPSGTGGRPNSVAVGNQIWSGQAPNNGQPAVVNQNNLPQVPNYAVANSSIIPPLQFPSQTPIFYDFYATSNTSYQQATPPNLILWVTSENYTYQREAKDICEINKYKICSLNQLQQAVRYGGNIPDFSYGWYDVEGRAASLAKCEPGVIKWHGQGCFNGDVTHQLVQRTTSLPALCCSIISGANVTVEKFVRQIDAQRECHKLNQHLCTLPEMLNVWQMSTYKDLLSGWFSKSGHLIKMVHYCDVNHVAWRGYLCIGGMLEITKIETSVQKHAFCCGSAHLARISSFSLLLTVLLILKHILL